MKKIYFILLVMLSLVSCTRAELEARPPRASATLETRLRPSSTASITPVPSLTTTPVPTASLTPSPSVTPVPINSATPTMSPTPNGPLFEVGMQANCRYGPGTAYLYSHGLYDGDRASIDGRNYSGSWLWIKPVDIDRHCWVSASVGEIFGDLSQVNTVQTRLPKSSLYGPPEGIDTARRDDKVIIEWEPVWMTEDDFRGYMIEASICQNGGLTWVAIQTDATSHEFVDEQGCAGESGGRLYAVEKHGYTDPIPIPWP